MWRSDTGNRMEEALRLLEGNKRRGGEMWKTNGKELAYTAQDGPQAAGSALLARTLIRFMD